MTTTYQPDGELAAPNHTRSRRGSATALAGGALLAAAALSMHLRGSVEDVEFVRRVEDAPGLWLTGHVFMAVGGILLVLGLIAVPGLVHGRGRRAVTVGAGLSAVGAASTALGDFAHGSLAYLLVGDVSAEQSLQIQKQFFSEPLIAAVSMPALLLPLGILVLGGGLLYSRAVPTPAALLVLFAPLTVQLGYMVTPLPMPVMVLPLVAGLGWVSLVLVRRPRQNPTSADVPARSSPASQPATAASGSPGSSSTRSGFTSSPSTQTARDPSSQRTDCCLLAMWANVVMFVLVLTPRISAYSPSHDRDEHEQGDPWRVPA